MNRLTVLVSSLMLIMVAPACIQPIPEPSDQEIVITPVAYQTQTPPEAPPDAPPKIIPSPSATPTPWPAAAPTPTYIMPTARPTPNRSVPPPTSVPEAVPREVISLSISLFLLVDDVEEPDPTISTHRAKEDLREILEGMNEIWSQADIRLELQTIEFVEVPEAMLHGMLAGNLAPFFNEIGDGITLPQVSTINGFYIRGVGGPNGINPFRSRAFFVIDEPSVFDRRVSSHEVGHILGLHHVLGDPDRLLFSGTNGMTLTEDEATVARNFAQGIIQGAR